MRRRATPVAIQVALLLYSGPVLAQSADSLDQTAAFRICNRPSLGPTRLIRVLAHARTDTRRGSVVGPLVRCGDGVLVIGLYPGQEIPEYQVPAGMIKGVWVRDNQKTWGLVSGLLIGGLAGGGLAAAKSNLCARGSPPVQTECSGDVFVGTALGAAIGGFVGSVLGSGFPHWTRIFP